MGLLTVCRYLYPVELVAAYELDNIRVHQKLYVVLLAELFDKRLLSPELAAPVDERDALAVSREEERRLKGTVSPADYRDVLTLIESPVAYSAVGHSPASKVIFAVRSERPVTRSGGDYNALALIAV